MKISYATIAFRCTKTLRHRVEEHANKRGGNMGELAREAVEAFVDILDAKEAEREERLLRIEEAKKLRRPRGLNRHGRPPKRQFSDVEIKIEQSFPRFAKYLEDAKNEEDAEKRAQTIVEEIRDRAASPEKAESYFARLREFIERRQDAKSVDVTSATIIAGDVD